MQAFPPKSFIKQFVTGKVAIEILKTKLHVIYVHAGRLLEVKPLFRAVKARLVSLFILIPRTNLKLQILVIPDDDEGEHVEDDAANLEAVLDPEEEEGGGGGEGEGEAAPVDEELAGEEAPAAEEGGEAPAEDVEL